MIITRIKLRVIEIPKFLQRSFDGADESSGTRERFKSDVILKVLHIKSSLISIRSFV